MAAVHEVHEIGGRAEAAGHREIADGLVAPGSVEGMLHDGHQFDVRVAHLLHVGDQFVGEFAIGEPAIAFGGLAPPRADVNFVNRHRRVQPVPRARARRARRRRFHS